VAVGRWFRCARVCVSAMKGLIMNRIVHLALKVEDLEKTTAFYQHMFGFQRWRHAHA